MDDGLPIWFTENGAVWHRRVARGPGDVPVELERRRVCAEGADVALAYDPDTGMAHSFGPRADVERWADTVRGNLAALGVGGLLTQGGMAVVAFLATPDSVAAALACWERTGSARTFAAAFGQTDGPAPSMRH